MKNRDVISKLKKLPEADASGMPSEAFLAAIQKEGAGRKQREPIGYRHFLKTQIYFIGWRIWAGQGILLSAILIGFSGFIRGLGAELAVVLPQILICLSLLVSGAILPILYRSYQYKMNEIEASTYYAAPRILIAKLIVVGVGDLTSLAAIALLTVLKTAIPFESAVLHLLCPFLLAVCGIFYLVNHCRIGMLLSGAGVVYALLIAGYVLLRRDFPAVFAQGSAVAWGLSCLVLLTLCVIQLCQITERPEFAELQII